MLSPGLLLHSGRRHGWHLLVATVLLVLCAGCGSGTAPAAERAAPMVSNDAFERGAGTRAEALRLLDTLRQDAMRSAFEALGSLGYTRHVRTEQLTAEGRVEAFEEHTTRHMPGGVRRLRGDSSGAFASSLFGRLAGGEQEAAPASDLAARALPDEPAFFSERNRHAFQYRLLPDTSLPGGGTARVVAVRARNNEDGQKQTVREARLVIDEDSRRLVGVALHRVRESLLFDEETRQRLHLRPGPEGGRWVPSETRFETRVKLPLRTPRRFRSAASYDRYRALSS